MLATFADELDQRLEHAFEQATQYRNQSHQCDGERDPFPKVLVVLGKPMKVGNHVTDISDLIDERYRRDDAADNGLRQARVFVEVALQNSPEPFKSVVHCDAPVISSLYNSAACSGVTRRP